MYQRNVSMLMTHDTCIDTHCETPPIFDDKIPVLIHHHINHLKVCKLTSGYDSQECLAKSETDIIM